MSKTYSYAQAVAFVESLGESKIHYSLAQVREALERLNRPQDAFSVIHVVGTNGKGSTSAFAESILRQAGYRTGWFSSPHLFCVRERIRLDGRAISKADFAREVNALRRKCAAWKIRLSHFEFLTVLALGFFREKGVEVGVIEAGLGGRLDATNVFRSSVVIVTSIGLDHEKLLGSSVKSIAREKAAVIKPRSIVVSARQPLAARIVIRSKAKKENARLFECGSAAFRVSNIRERFRQTFLDFEFQNRSIRRLSILLLGAHQAENAALALAAVVSLDAKPHQVGAIRRGLREAYWPFRIEVLSRRPLLIADVAHNPHGVERLKRTLEALFPRVPFIGCFACANDKDFARMLKPLFSRLTAIILFESPCRGRDPVEIDSWIANQNVRIPSIVAPSPKTAIEWAREIRFPGEGIVVYGSHYFFEKTGLKPSNRTFK